MTVRRVLKMGDPLLFRVAEPVQEFDSQELHALVGDMFDTMGAQWRRSRCPANRDFPARGDFRRGGQSALSGC